MALTAGDYIFLRTIMALKCHLGVYSLLFILITCSDTLQSPLSCASYFFFMVQIWQFNAAFLLRQNMTEDLLTNRWEVLCRTDPPGSSTLIKCQVSGVTLEAPFFSVIPLFLTFFHFCVWLLELQWLVDKCQEFKHLLVPMWAFASFLDSKWRAFGFWSKYIYKYI